MPTDTLVFPDLRAWSGWTHRLARPRRTHLLVDTAVAGSELDRRIGEILDGAGRSVHRRVVAPGADLARLRADSGARPDDLVVGVGGGGVMDRAKLLALVAGDEQVERRLTTRHRCGFIVLPEGHRRPTPLALVPTTLGTGAELSRSACVEVGGHKRLVYGDALRADSAVHTALATDRLPAALVAEGILEALLRLAAPYAGSLGDLATRDALVERHVDRLARLGTRVRAARRARRPISRATRIGVAEISGASHTDAVLDGRDPFCDVAWPLANELSMGTGTRKLTALAALTPVLWQRISAGDERLGSARRLDRLWATLRSAVPGRPSPVPADGLVELMDRWGIDRSIDAPVTADALAQRAERNWGRGLPMLKGLTVREISALYAEVLTPVAIDLSASSTERRECSA